jgi:pimeloyl-ACP methyl ester carboxylesterase
MPVLTTPSATVAYDETGTGDPLLLLHATLHDRSDFSDVVPQLSRTHRVIALDWPGHGESPLPLDGREPGSGVFADVLEEFVDALDLRDVVLIGNSVGGHAACRLAATRPDRVAAVVTVQGAGFTPDAAWVRAYCRFVGRPRMARRMFPAFARAYLRPTSEHDREILRQVTARAHSDEGAATFAAMWRSFAEPGNDLSPYAARITAPLLVTWGKHDLTLPRSWARRAHRAVPGSRFAYLDTGHLPFTSDPRAFLDLVDPWIAGVRQARHDARPDGS